MNGAKRVLLVEPVLILQAAMKASISRLGWEVNIAPDDKSGLEKALTESFDLILVDISQDAAMDGFSLVEKIKQQAVINKETPLCAITVHDIPENRERARLLGVDGFFEGMHLVKVAEEIDTFMEKEFAKREGR